MLAALFSESGRTPVVDLARRVAAEERGVAPDEVPNGTVEDVKADIYATHPPTLAALRVVDSLLASVEPAENAPEVRGRFGDT